MTLQVLPGHFALCRLDPKAPIPSWTHAGFSSITRAYDELSLVCPEEYAPADVEREAGWSALAIQGPFDFDQTGILSSLLTPLANEGIGVFTISTFSTDYIFVRADTLERAVNTLSHAGHTVLFPD